MTKEMSKQTEQKLVQIQLLEQNIQNISLQKQQFSSQLLEIENALKEVEKSEQAYKIVGNIMVLMKQKDITEELIQKKDLITVRIESLEKQEQKLREKATAFQQSIVGELNGEKNG